MTAPDIAAQCERLRAEEMDPFAPGLRHVSYVNPDGPEAADTIERQADEIERLRDSLLGIALSDHYRRYPKQHEDGGVRGQSGLRAVRALTGQHGSYLSDDDVVRLDKETRAALTGEPQMTTCQRCGGEVQGWLCQGCGQAFREADGKLVFDHAARTTFDGCVLVPREPTEEMVTAVQKALAAPAPGYTSRTNSLDRFNLLARHIASAVIAAAPPVDWQITGSPETTADAFAQGGLPDGFYGGNYYSRIKPAPPVDGWQTIETAPRDGTPVLLLIDGVAIEGEWDKQTRADGYVYGDGQWEVVSLLSHGCSCCSQQNPAPTAWMPLPQPPNNERTG
jgi:hypothetical protein